MGKDRLCYAHRDFTNRDTTLIGRERSFAAALPAVKLFC